MNITPLPTPTSTTLRSSLIIPSFSQILSELVQNSLDAEASTVDIYLDLTKGNESIRVDDDGHGITEEGLKKLGKRFRTSKTLNQGGLGSVGSYGFRGEALPSIAALSLLSITTQVSASSPCRTKILKSSRTLYSGVHPSRTIPFPDHGTSVSVKEIFHNVPVRREELSKISEDSLLRSCKRVVEVLALSRPRVAWTLSEERAVGMSMGLGMSMSGRKGAGSKKILSIDRTKSSTEVFKAIHGNALVKRVQNIRVSTGTRRVDGFISLSGDVTKAHQHLYINHYPIERGELHLAISKKFSASRFATYATSGEHDDLEYLTPQTRRSPRRLERHPIYVLSVTLPPGEVDVAYEPKKGIVGYKDFGAVRALLLAVVDEYLIRNGYGSARTAQSLTPSPTKLSPSKPAARVDTPTTTALHGRSPLSKDITKSAPRWDLTRPAPPSFASVRTTKAGELDSSDVPNRHQRPALLPLSSQHFSSSVVASVDPTPPGTPVIAQQPSEPQSSSTSAEKINYSPRINEQSTRKHQWITELESSIDTGVLLSSRHRSPLKRSLDMVDLETDDIEQVLDANEGVTLPVDLPHVASRKTEVRLTKEAIRCATVIGQVDTKYVAAALPVSSGVGLGHNAIILVDQHAADERISVESIIFALCSGFRTHTIPTTTLSKPPVILLTRAEGDELSRRGMIDIFRRWGISLSLPDISSSKGDYIQVGVENVPTALVTRLGKKEGVEMSRLIRGYLPVLSEALGEVDALIRSYGPGVGTESSQSLQHDETEPRGGDLIAAGEGRTGEEGPAGNDGIPVDSVTESKDQQWGKEMRFMPREMLELANSKACRSAIMFEDRLTSDQCTRLLAQLGDTRFPFMCAHGRPSMVPIVALQHLARDADGMTGGDRSDRKRCKRSIDWVAVKERIRKL